MGLRIQVSDFTEETSQIVFALVVRTEDNANTFGGGYVTMAKPVTEAKLDTAVQKIVVEGDLAYPKKLSASDRAGLVEIDTPLSYRILENLARQKNIKDWPALGRKS
jgi:hypothetical protein